MQEKMETNVMFLPDKKKVQNSLDRKKKLVNKLKSKIND